MKTLGTYKSFATVITKQKAVVASLAILIIMLFFDTNFYTTFNMMELLKSVSILEILAFGVTLTVICGGCDLSVGGVMCLSGILAIQFMEHMPMWLALLLAVLAGGVVGFVNGFFIVYQKTEPFIITLGTGMLLKGLNQQLTDAHPISPNGMDFMELSNGKLFGVVPNLVIVMIAVFFLMLYVLRYTAFGRNCYAIGGDYDVAVYSGINVIFTKWAAYVICGMTAALGGIMLSSLLNSGSSTYGDTTALLVNCGVVVGGTSFAGGIGGIPQSAVGLMVFGLLENSMNMLFIDAYVQQILKGVVIVAIIWLDCYGRKRKRETV